MSDEQIKTDPDIVQRLRSGYTPETMVEAANEIERLRAIITEWADASAEYDGSATPAAIARYMDTVAALLEAVGR